MRRTSAGDAATQGLVWIGESCLMKTHTRRKFLATSAALGCGALLASGRRASASPAWSDVRQTGPFVFRATFPLDEEEALINELPDLQRELSRVLAIKPPRRPIDVFLLGDRLEHRKFLHESYPKVPYRRALFVKKSGHCQVYAYRQSELDIDLRHECTHALLHSELDLVPLWLDEGIAEYFEAASAERAFNHPHFSVLKWNMRMGWVRTIRELEKKHDLSDMNGTDYRFSWAWTHFMFHGPQPAYEELLSFLGDVRRGAAPGRFSERLATAMPDAPDRLIQHFKHWQQPISKNG
jgi:hypothetical protein